MAVPNFPTAHFCKSIVRFLDTIEYDDFNLMCEERILALREVHSKIAKYFAQPLPREMLKDIHPARIATVCRTISHLVSIINVLDDEVSADPPANTSTLLTDMLAGRPPSQPFWKLCCWIEQHSFQAWRGADCYPMFVRRLTTPGSGVAGSLFPASGGFDDQALFKEMSIVMVHVDGIVALPNDLLSFYKEFDQDEPNLVSNLCVVQGITMEQALERLTDKCIHSFVRILELLADKDAAVRQTIRGFIHGDATWHSCELRYRMKEVYDAGAVPELGLVGKTFREYQDRAFSVGWVPLEEWSLPGD